MVGALPDQSKQGGQLRCVVVTPRGEQSPTDLIEGLRRRGVEVRHAQDGTEALSAVRERGASMMVLVESQKLGDLNGLAASASRQVAGRRIWTYSPHDAEPLKPY